MGEQVVVGSEGVRVLHLGDVGENRPHRRQDVSGHCCRPPSRGDLGVRDTGAAGGTGRGARAVSTYHPPSSAGSATSTTATSPSCDRRLRNPSTTSGSRPRAPPTTTASTPNSRHSVSTPTAHWSR